MLECEKLKGKYACPWFKAVDHHFAGLLCRYSENCDSSGLYLSSLVLSAMTRAGHAAIDLKALAGKDIGVLSQDKGCAGRLPEYGQWKGALRACQDVVGDRTHTDRPLVLDNDLLYLNKFWKYEVFTAKRILAMSRRTHRFQRHALTGKLFPCEPDDINYQFVAAAATMGANFTVITGGPGTGKTYTAARVLALHLAVNPDMVIRLAAPTGKAAQRLGEAIKAAKAGLAGILDRQTLDIIPEQATTLHRLLGYHPDVGFRFNAENPLPVDMVIVDEASMVDLPLFAALFEALPGDAALVLLGDKDQLASVETGSVFHELTGPGMLNRFDRDFVSGLDLLGYRGKPLPTTGQGTLQGRVIRLIKNHRVAGGSGIGVAAVLVNHAQDAQDVAGLIDVLRTGRLEDERFRKLVYENTGIQPGDRFDDLEWRQVEEPEDALRRAVGPGNILSGFTGYREKVDLAAKGRANPQEVMDSLARFRVLCATNGGDFGVTGVNRVFDRLMGHAPDEPWYHGRAVMVLHNDYNLNLMNGDVGVVLRAQSGLRAYFPAEGGGLRSFPVSSLPPNQTAFAMTIHKSQGSEFDQVLVLLPATDNPVLTKELIYTGITRARKTVAIWSTPEVFTNAVLRRTRRVSGLLGRLKQQ